MDARTLKWLIIKVTRNSGVRSLLELEQQIRFTIQKIYGLMGSC